MKDITKINWSTDEENKTTYTPVYTLEQLKELQQFFNNCNCRCSINVDDIDKLQQKSRLNQRCKI
jgi:hypothetical protein